MTLRSSRHALRPNQPCNHFRWRTRYHVCCRRSGALRQHYRCLSFHRQSPAKDKHRTNNIDTSPVENYSIIGNDLQYVERPASDRTNRSTDVNTLTWCRRHSLGRISRVKFAATSSFVQRTDIPKRGSPVKSNPPP